MRAETYHQGRSESGNHLRKLGLATGAAWPGDRPARPLCGMARASPAGVGHRRRTWTDRISTAGDDGMVPLQTRSSPGRTRRGHPGRGESRGEQYLVARNGNRSHKNWHDGDATCARERGGALYPASGRSRRGRLRLQVIGHPEPAGQPIGGDGSAELLHGDAESLMDGISSSWRSAAARRNWVSAADRSPTRSARRPSPS